MKSWRKPKIPIIKEFNFPLRLLDSTTNQIIPINLKNKVFKIYVCGITPYDATHLGHAATYITFDLINRFYLSQNYQINFSQGITDIDDPLLERANKLNINWQKLANSEIQLFKTDMEFLRIYPPNHFIKVTEIMEELSKSVITLLNKKLAYSLPGKIFDIYLDSNHIINLGHTQKYNPQNLLSLFKSRGGDPEVLEKRNKFDPLLWRAKRPGEPYWNSPLGAGRPGWHLECSVIALNTLGSSIDIMGGGKDLIFPHHEYSAKLAEFLRDKNKFTKHVVNTGMLEYCGQKMSKSLGNLVFVKDYLANKLNPNAIRLAVYLSHYSKDRPWNNDLIIIAEKYLQLWRSAILKTVDLSAVEQLIIKLYQHISTNLNTPAAIAAINHWANQTVSDPKFNSNTTTTLSVAGQKIRNTLSALFGLEV